MKANPIFKTRKEHKIFNPFPVKIKMKPTLFSDASDERDGGDSDESYIMECEDEPIMQNQLRQLVIVEPESEGIELFLL